MNRRLVVVGAAIAVVLLGIGAVALVVHLRGGDGSGDTVAARVPPKKVTDALAQHATAMALRPLPGSVPTAVSPHTFTLAKTCAQVKEAYRASGAPVPAGATFSDAPDGTLVVTDPYGDPEGVVVSDLNGSCEYTLAAQPTVVVTGKGPIAAGGYWGPVGCATMFDDPAKGDEVAAFTAGSQPWVLAAGTQDQNGDTAPSADQYQAILLKGTLDQYRNTFANNTPAGDIYPMAATDTVDGAIALAFGGAANGQVITLTCTTEYGRIGGLSLS